MNPTGKEMVHLACQHYN